MAIQPVLAGNVKIVKVQASQKSPGIYSFSVTLKHGDTGWKHYADGWEVVGPGGKVLGVRTLHHPHVNEKPFTRGLSGVNIPGGIKKVHVRAHDKVHGTAAKTFSVKLPGRSNSSDYFLSFKELSQLYKIGTVMARLETIPSGEQKMMIELDCSGFENRRPFVPPKALNERRVAILSTAALNLKGDEVYQRGATDYSVIPGDVDPGDVVMSHVSVNFDRTGFQQDLNVCYPIERLDEMARDNVIGSVANFHFTVSGAAHPLEFEGSAYAIAQKMKADGVDTVLLVPI
jgi:D-proline reductase (dithiol) PrdB